MLAPYSFAHQHPLPRSCSRSRSPVASVTTAPCGLPPDWVSTPRTTSTVGCRTRISSRWPCGSGATWRGTAASPPAQRCFCCIDTEGGGSAEEQNRDNHVVGGLDAAGDGAHLPSEWSALPDVPSVEALELCMSDRTLGRYVRRATGKSTSALIQSHPERAVPVG